MKVENRNMGLVIIGDREKYARFARTRVMKSIEDQLMGFTWYLAAPRDFQGREAAASLREAWMKRVKNRKFALQTGDNIEALNGIRLAPSGNRMPAYASWEPAPKAARRNSLTNTAFQAKTGD